MASGGHFERFKRQRAALTALAERHPEGICFVCLIGADVPPPDSELRKATTQMVAFLGKRLRCIACVIEGEGFRAALRLSGVPMLFVGFASWVAVAVVDAVLANHTVEPPAPRAGWSVRPWASIAKPAAGISLDLIFE